MRPPRLFCCVTNEFNFIILPMAIIAYAENEINILLWMIISINLDRKSFHRQYSNLPTAFKKQF